jgi:hypothetical protein
MVHVPFLPFASAQGHADATPTPSGSRNGGDASPLPIHPRALSLAPARRTVALKGERARHSRGGQRPRRLKRHLRSLLREGKSTEERGGGQTRGEKRGRSEKFISEEASARGRRLPGKKIGNGNSPLSRGGACTERRRGARRRDRNPSLSRPRGTRPRRTAQRAAAARASGAPPRQLYEASFFLPACAKRTRAMYGRGGGRALFRPVVPLFPRRAISAPRARRLLQRDRRRGAGAARHRNRLPFAYRQENSFSYGSSERSRVFRRIDGNMSRSIAFASPCLIRPLH